jgi:hypothetical protein
LLKAKTGKYLEQFTGLRNERKICDCLLNARLNIVEGSLLYGSARNLEYRYNIAAGEDSG